VRALFGARVARVVAAIPDPNQDDPVPQMRGIHYRVGCLAEVAEQIHGGFLKRVRTGMPRVTAKWAMTADGFLATSNGASSWISSPEALALSRRRRRAFDAILVGAGTARRDDPQLLSSRPRAHGEQAGPLRVVVSASGEIKPKSRLLASVAQAPLLVVHAQSLPESRRGELRRSGAQVKAVADPHDAQQVLRALGELGINDLLVEGGAALHGAWLRAGAVDRLELYLGLRTLGGGTPVAAGEGAATLGHAQEWLPEVGPIALGTTMCLRMRRA
jgi:diaminohydroxyphosphoribosylaminopyrimidine deaminase/5-amino-6-(5-phosphoribosylamino)uracil reductase